MEIHGTYADAFRPVRDRFEQNFLDGLEAGACVAVTVDGAPVVDLWAGEAGPDGAPWQRDTIANVWSPPRRWPPFACSCSPTAASSTSTPPSPTTGPSSPRTARRASSSGT